MQDRREAPRWEHETRAIVSVGRNRFSSTTVDLSASGILLLADAQTPPPAGETVEVSFALPNERKMRKAKAQLIRTVQIEHQTAWALRFCELPEAERRVIEEFVAERERAPTNKPRLQSGTTFAPEDEHVMPAPRHNSLIDDLILED